MCTPVAPPLGLADLAHLHFRSTELSSSKRQKEKLYSDALWGATSGWCAACGSRLSSVGVIYDIVHAAPVMVVRWASCVQARRDPRTSCSDLRCPNHPSGHRTGGAHRDRLAVSGVSGHQHRSLAMQVRRSERFTILIARQEVTGGRTRSATLLV